MRTVRLGKTGLMVSEVGFGGIPIIPLGLEDAASVVRYCFDQGITFFDTANMYRDSERKIGMALESVRNEVTIATKTLARKAEQASKHIEYSLENLKTRNIDIYQLHCVSNEETLQQVLAPGGAYEALDNARADGKIKFIGLSSHNIPTAIKACQMGLFDTLQFPFNLIETDPAEDLFKVAKEMEMGIIAMKPLGGGLLERADLCFRFLQQYPQIVPIPGIKAREEADEIVELYRSPKPLTEADWKQIDKIRSELGTKFCHRCEYCMPCEQGVQITGVLGFRAFAKRLLPPAAIAIMDTAMKSIENCAECEACVDKCPYELPIPDLLKDNLAVFNEYVKQHG